MAYTRARDLRAIARARRAGLSWERAARKGGVNASTVMRMRQRRDPDWLAAVEAVGGLDD